MLCVCVCVYACVYVCVREKKKRKTSCHYDFRKADERVAALLRASASDAWGPQRRDRRCQGARLNYCFSMPLDAFLAFCYCFFTTPVAHVSCSISHAFTGCCYAARYYCPLPQR